MVLFPYRESYYDTENKDKNKEEEEEAPKEIMEIIIGKNRNGEVRNVNLGWIGKYQRVLGLQ